MTCRRIDGGDGGVSPLACSVAEEDDALRIVPSVDMNMELRLGWFGSVAEEMKIEKVDIDGAPRWLSDRAGGRDKMSPLGVAS